MTIIPSFEIVYLFFQIFQDFFIIINNSIQIFFNQIPASEKEKYNLYKFEKGSAIILGIENKTQDEIKLVLKTKNCFNINPKEWNYKEETFKIFLK